MRSKPKTPSCRTHRRSLWQLPTLLLLLASFGMTAGCAERIVVKTDFCTPWRAIYASRKDVLTDSTAKQIKDHDETGVKLGCWKAPEKAKPVKAR